ncbi:RsmE family RNA methyltransferase [Leptospira jelokensis]|uniref:RsmE family RNA methyltransferase n=1 Tax=Leptospira jelokensis TaxID=2484931 RepID=UPI001090F069|nr:RsmE family RNA methyltransferase [Leptospira jelokensis]TGL99608.1 RsmE family RNA methyltransferase [Leptospira jelokensis]
MNWIVVEASEISSDRTVQVAGSRHDHIVSILKKKTNDSVLVVVPGLGNFRFQITMISNNKTVLEEVETLPRVLEPLTIHCMFSLPRPQTAKKILHLAGAYGLTSLHFFATETKNKEYWTSPVYTKDWKDLLFTGLSQTGNDHLPSVHMRQKENWKQFLTSWMGSVHILDREGSCEMQKFPQSPSANKDTLFVFGPESGWKESDHLFFKDQSFTKISLGNINLRTEFAFSSLLYFLFRN